MKNEEAGPKNENAGPKQEGCSVVDVSGGESRVRCSTSLHLFVYCVDFL